MRVITRRATMLAGDRSRGEISPASILNESRDYLNFVHWRIYCFMWLAHLRVFQRTLEFISYTQNLPIESSAINNHTIETRRSQYISGSQRTIYTLHCNNVQHHYIAFIIAQWMLQITTMYLQSLRIWVVQLVSSSQFYMSQIVTVL